MAKNVLDTAPSCTFSPFAGSANEHNKKIEIMTRTIGLHVSSASNDVSESREHLAQYGNGICFRLRFDSANDVARQSVERRFLRRCWIIHGTRRKRSKVCAC